MNSPSVDLLDEAVLASPYAAFEELRATGPVHHQPSLDLYFVLDHEAIREVLDDPDTYSSHLVAVLQRMRGGVSLPASDVIPTGADVLAIADPPAHTAHRKLVQPTFSRREVQNLTEAIDDEVTSRMDAFVAGGGGDFMAAVASPVPVGVISRILGLPERDADRLVRWSDIALELLGGLADADRLEVIFEEIAGFMDYLGEQLDDGSAGVIGEVRGAVAGGQLTRDEAIGLLAQLVAAGTESTTSLLGSSVRIMACDEELQSHLRADPSLIDDLIDESLRLESPFRGHFRVATCDATLGGTRIPAGGRLMLLWGAANRDPRRYEEPERFELGRPSGKGHLGFGRGIHFCLGAHLARLEAQRTIERLLQLTADIHLWAGHEDSYHPSLLIRRLENLFLSVTPRP